MKQRKPLSMFALHVLGMAAVLSVSSGCAAQYDTRDLPPRYVDDRRPDPRDDPRSYPPAADDRRTDPRDDPRSYPPAADDRRADPRDDPRADDRRPDPRDDPRGPVRTEVTDEVVYEAPPREAYATYEQDLNPYGHWVDTRQYGRCWMPNDRPREWRPYTIGHWVNTDEGWSWVAEDREADWGYVTYHYGRWYEDEREGWVWIPGTTYGPAWVAWREGDGVAGWTPLPPQCGFGVDLRLDLVDRYCPPERYTYCDQRYLYQPRAYDHYIRDRNVTVISRTTNITNITIVNSRVVNRGVSVEHVERYAGRRIDRVEIAEVRSPAEAKRARSEGRAVSYRPQAIVQADTSYRERVDRRVVEARTAEKERVQRRAADATSAKQAENERAQRRAADATTEKRAEQERVQRRATDAATEKQAEHDRAVRRANEPKSAPQATTPQPTDRTRAARIAEEDAAAKQAEHERATRRASEAATPKAAEPDRSRAARVADDAATAKQAEHERAVRRASEKPADPKGTSTEKVRTAGDRDKKD